MSPRVFLSSIMSGYESYRAAARRGVAVAGGHPVMIEDGGPNPASPRNACLNLVQTSQAFLLVIGPRGGFRAPSGKLVVEEEFEEALRLGLPCWVLIQSGPRDRDGQELVERLSDYVTGRLRATFEDEQGLEALCAKAIENAMTGLTSLPRDPEVVQAALDLTRTSTSFLRVERPRIRLAIAPGVRAELIDPLRLDDDGFQRTVQELAHRSRLFDYRLGSEPRARADDLLVEQKDSRDVRSALVHIEAHGLLICERVVGDPRREFDGTGYLSDSFELVEAELEAAVTATFSFVVDLLDKVDPHARFPSLIYNIALLDAGQRRIVAARSKATSMMGVKDAGPVTAHPEPRPVSRAALREAQGEIRRVVTMLRKRLDDARRSEWERR